MIIESADKKRAVDIGTDDIWISVYSTVLLKLGSTLADIPDAVSFLRTGMCKAERALSTARQINMVRDKLAAIPPQEAVYNYKNRSERAPWDNKISPVITSCANLFTTAEGKDLLFEIVSILCYADIKKVDVVPV